MSTQCSKRSVPAPWFPPLYNTGAWACVTRSLDVGGRTFPSYGGFGDTARALSVALAPQRGGHPDVQVTAGGGSVRLPQDGAREGRRRDRVPPRQPHISGESHVCANNVCKHCHEKHAEFVPGYLTVRRRGQHGASTVPGVTLCHLVSSWTTSDRVDMCDLALLS